MANTKSALKAIRVSEKRRLHNKAARSRMRTTIKKAEGVLAAGETQETAQAVLAALSIIDRTASKGVIHRNQAARRKSRLMKRLNKLQAQA
ncbi:MAG: 30S ribosomal protein S20 [Chloroflexota bacterium]